MDRTIGSCQCGLNQVEFYSTPIARFICHCLVCQKYTGQPYADVSVFKSSQILDMDIRATQLKRYKLPPNIQRGLCKKCQKPSVEFGLLGKLVIIATKNLKSQNNLPEPKMHIFYHRRIRDIEDELPKYDGFVKSQLQASKIILQGLISKKTS